MKSYAAKQGRPARPARRQHNFMKYKNRQRALKAQRTRRHARVRAKIKGTASRPRLSVFRSNTGVFTQLIDDATGKTLVSASAKEVKGEGAEGAEMSRKVSEAFAVGALLGERAKQKGITVVVFDKGPYAYHGRVKAVAEGARKSGLSF